jgi:hypothetical protein
MVICGMIMYILIRSGPRRTGGTILRGAAGTGGITAIRVFTIPGSGTVTAGITIGIIRTTGTVTTIRTGRRGVITIPTGPGITAGVTEERPTVSLLGTGIRLE